MLTKENKDRNEILLERLTKFSEKLIILCQKLPKTIVNRPLIQQVIPSGTSMGANYNEACEAESARDFVHKMGIAKKEARETKYWLRLLQSPSENLSYKSELQELRDEANEYVLIFASIISKFKDKK